MHIDETAMKPLFGSHFRYGATSGKALRVFASIVLVGMLQACQPPPVKVVKNFDVPYGLFQTLIRQNVLPKGELLCKVHVAKNNLGDAWVPAVVLAAAEDDEEDYSLFLTSSPTKPVSDTRLFTLRTHVEDKPVLDSTIYEARDTNGDFSLRLAWHEDGSITYQVATESSKSEEQLLQKPGFQTRHVSLHTSGVTGTTTCELTGAKTDAR